MRGWAGGLESLKITSKQLTQIVQHLWTLRTLVHTHLKKDNPIKAANSVNHWLNERQSLQSPVTIMRIPLLFVSLIPRLMLKCVDSVCLYMRVCVSVCVGERLSVRQSE